MSRKICIFATHHAYQYQAFRLKYLQEVKNLIGIHSVDLVAEEAAGLPGRTYAQELVEREFASSTVWKNVDLNKEERKGIPDKNPLGIGTLIDFDFNMARERAWVARTSGAMRDSALLICGLAHTFSVADKFRTAGFEVEVNAFFDRSDEGIILDGS